MFPTSTSRSLQLFRTLTLCLVINDNILQISGKLIAGYVMPHGWMAIDPSHFYTENATSRAEAWELNRACSAVGQQIRLLAPDVVLLSTPHGISDSRNFMVYLNPKGEGFYNHDDVCPKCRFNVTVDFNQHISKDLASHLGHENNVSGLYGFGAKDPFPLRWGEVIPLHFLGKDFLKSTSVVMISSPLRKKEHQELLQLGADMYAYLKGLKERVVVIISGDLAHTHLADGVYGYSNTSAPFDNAVGEWASTLDERPLLETAAELAGSAKSCGYPGFVMLHGMLVAGGLSSWQPDLLVNHHPSYFGMMVASFTPRG